MSWYDQGALRWTAMVAAVFAVAGLALLCVFIAMVVFQFRPPFPGAGPAVAVVRIEGVISSSGGDLLSGPGARSDEIVKKLEDAIENHEVAAVVLRINSPGGGVVASDEIHTAVLKVREAKKPVVASLGELAASGGYYVAVAADRIVANPQTTTGSIGVISMVPVVEGLLERIGVEIEIVRSGPLKGSPSGLAPLGDTERAIIQELVDGAYERFVNLVAQGRRMDLARVRELADGRVYSGAQAARLGLVDELGNLSEAVDRAGELAGIHGKPRVIEEHPPSLIDDLLSLRAIGRLQPTAAAGFQVDRLAPLQYLYLGTGR